MRFVGMSIPIPDDIWEINKGIHKMNIRGALGHWENKRNMAEIGQHNLSGTTIGNKLSGHEFHVKNVTGTSKADSR
jgi:hypothetical protein